MPSSAYFPKSVLDSLSASNLTIADVGNAFTASTIEGALAELAEGDSRLAPIYGFDLSARDFVTGTAVVTAVKDKPCFKEFTAPNDMVCTGMSMASSTVVSAGLTFARYFLMHVGRRYGQTGTNTGSYTVLARSANDTTLFNTASTVYAKSWDNTGGWPTAVRLRAGQRYAAGYQIVGTTAPQLLSNGTAVRPQVTALGIAPYVGGSVGGLGVLTDLAPYWNGTSLNASASEGYMPWYNLTLDPDSTAKRPISTALVGDSYFGSFAGWAAYANALSNARIIPTYNAGVGGETTTQMLTRLAPVVASLPQAIILMAGINDVANGVSAATIQANLTSMMAALRVNDTKVVLCTLPPTTSMDAAKLITLAAVNAWIKTFNAVGVYPVDTGITMTTGDGVTRDATKYVDGTHPNDLGQLAMAVPLAAVLTTMAATL